MRSLSLLKGDLDQESLKGGTRSGGIPSQRNPWSSQTVTAAQTSDGSRRVPMVRHVNRKISP